MGSTVGKPLRVKVGGVGGVQGHYGRLRGLLVARRESARKPMTSVVGQGPLRPCMSEVWGTIHGVKYRSTNKCVYSAKDHVIAG